MRQTGWGRTLHRVDERSGHAGEDVTPATATAGGDLLFFFENDAMKVVDYRPEVLICPFCCMDIVPTRLLQAIIESTSIAR